MIQIVQIMKHCWTNCMIDSVFAAEHLLVSEYAHLSHIVCLVCRMKLTVTHDVRAK